MRFSSHAPFAKKEAAGASAEKLPRTRPSGQRERVNVRFPRRFEVSRSKMGVAAAAGPMIFGGLMAAGAGCAVPTIGRGDAGGAATSATDAGDAAATPSARVAGLSCGTDPASGATLCLGISSCPGVVVDGDAFPSCGYRMSGATLDLECVCDGMLCPIGVATTCAQASALLQAQTQLQVCSQVNEGRCTQAAGGADSGAPSTAGSSCDPDCRSECAGAPGCLQLCGC